MFWPGSLTVTSMMLYFTVAVLSLITAYCGYGALHYSILSLSTTH